MTIEMVTTLTAQMSDLLRPTIQIYDAHVVDLYQWVCSRYLVCVKGAGTKATTVKLGSRPIFRKDYVGFPTPVRSEATRGSTIEIRKFNLYFNGLAEGEELGSNLLHVDQRGVG